MIHKTTPLSTSLCIIAIFLLGSLGVGHSQNIGINTTGATPNSAALLDIDDSGTATGKGLLVPRMTTARRDAIPPPIPESLLIYNTTTQCFEAWNQSITAWVSFGCIGCTVMPTVANAGPDQALSCNLTTATLAGNSPVTGTGMWSVISGTATISNPTSPTSGVTGLAGAGSAILRWTISNSPCTPSFDDIMITTCLPSFPCGGTVIPVVDVLNPITGETWMDRNLGASQVATSSADALAYGDFYQWGRCSDGHETRTSGTTVTLSATDTPGHANFILTSAAPNDWRSPQNDNLWQGVAGINNPCPTGYRIPTDPELDAEQLSWTTQDAAGAFGSPLKFPANGGRASIDGSIGSAGVNGLYWSSTVSFGQSMYLHFDAGFSGVITSPRSGGKAVRCIKD
jgi:hypothetical protein